MAPKRRPIPPPPLVPVAGRPPPPAARPSAPPPKRTRIAASRAYVLNALSAVWAARSKFAQLTRYEQVSWGFEIVTALLSILDVVSDVLVAHQFFSEGHMGWFWMVIASLLVSNIIYSIMGMDLVLREKYQIHANTSLQAVLQFCLFFPVAQGVPLVLWFFEARDQWCGTTAEAAPEGDMPREDSWALSTDDKGAASAVREDLEEDLEIRRLVHKFDKGFKKHLKAHAGFYVETLVEAAPQAVIQLLAVTSLGQATGVQLLSMCLSLFSIVSKAYIVAMSFDLRAMLFKAALVAFDVFSLFFIFSTLVAQNETVETTVSFIVPSFIGLATTEPSGVLGLAWIELQVSWLAGIWLRFAFTMVTLATVWFFGSFGAILFEEMITTRRVRIQKDNWFVPILVTGGFFTCVFPALLAVQAAKATLLLLLMIAVLGVMPREGTAAFYALTFGFYRKGVVRGSAEGKSRFHHVLHYVVDNSMNNMRSRIRCSMAGHNGEADLAQLLADRMHRLIDEDRIRPWSYRRVVHAQLPASGPGVPKPPFFRRFRPKPRDVWIGFVCVCALLTALFLVASACFNLAFPFLHVWYYGVSNLNLLQATCLACSAVAMAMIGLLGPFMYHFVCFSYVLADIGVVFNEVTLTAKSASECMAKYYTPPHVSILRAGIASSVLPREVVDVVADFIDSCDVDVSQLTVEQCAMLKDRTR